MSAPWLDVIGMGLDGVEGLSGAARARLEAAELVVGGPRHHALVEGLDAERLVWPQPFRILAEEIGRWRGRRVAILVSGDPLWYSAGSVLLRSFDPDEVTFHPNLSSFQLAAAAMKWSLSGVETVTIHGRPAEQALPFLAHGVRLLILGQDPGSPGKVASLLRDCGLGDSRITVLADLGGSAESRIEGNAAGWSAEVPPLHVLAVECVADGTGTWLPRTGLPDDAFLSDGMITKREIRSLTLSALAPRRGQRLWDIGIGCGSVAIEWMRSERDMEATGVDVSGSRLAMAAANSMRLGAPRLDLRKGEAIGCIGDLPRPDAVFIGGGLSVELAGKCLDALPRHGRLVANAVTLESEALLAELHATHGGELIRLSVARAAPVGNRHGWRPMMPVTQWRKVT